MTTKHAWTKQFFAAAIGCFSINIAAQTEVDSAKVAAVHQEENYPLRYLDRPSVMPIGTINLDVNAKLTGLKTVGVDFDTKFGIVNEVEGWFGYDGLKFNNVKTKRIFERTIYLGAKFHYLSMAPISGSFTMKLPIHILDDEIIQEIIFGLPVLAYTQRMAGGIFSDLLEFKMRPKIEAKLNFKIWYGIQFTDHLWANLDGSLGKIQVSNPQNQARIISLGFWQELPLSVTALYAFSNAFDVSASFGVDNALKAADSMNFGLGISYRAGRLFGETAKKM